MARNFDERRRERQISTQEDRSFTIGGEEFVARPAVKPEVLIRFSDLKAETPAAETLQTCDELVLELIEPDNDSHARYTALRAREEDPLNLADLIELCEWLIAAQASRPTSPPGGSSTSLGGTGTTSTDGSSSPAIPTGSPA